MAVGAAARYLTGVLLCDRIAGSSMLRALPSDEHKRFDLYDFGRSVVAAALFISTIAPLMMPNLLRAPGVVAILFAASITCSALLMLRLRKSAWAKWGRAAWLSTWVFCAALFAGCVVDVPFWAVIAVKMAVTSSVAGVCVALGAEGRAVRENDSPPAWRSAAIAAAIGWPAFVLVAAVWTDEMESAFRRMPALLILGGGALIFGPVVLVYRAASVTRLPVQFRGWCLRCGYDMRALSTRVCPECGSTSYLKEGTRADPTARPGTVKQVLLHGATAVLGAAALGAVLPNNELHRFKPLWLLMRECRLGPEAFSSHSVANGRGGFPPMREIFRRADDGEFDQVAARQLAEHCLRVQADANAPLYQWPELFVLLDAQGFVTDAQRRAFEDNLAVYTLKLPQSVPEGGHLPFTVEVASRGPWPFKSSISVQDWMVDDPRLMTVFVDGVQIPSPTRSADTIIRNYPSVQDFTAAAALPRMPLGPGKHRVSMEFEVKSWTNDHVKQVSTPVVKRTVKLEGDVTLTPGAPPPVIRITDPASLKPLLKKWTWTYESFRLGGYRGREGIAIQVPDDEPPLSFSVTADVVVEYKGKEYPFGRLALKAGDRSAFIHNQTGLTWEPDFPGDVLPLVIRATNVEFESGLSSAWAGPEQRVNAKFRDPPPKRDGAPSN